MLSAAARGGRQLRTACGMQIVAEIRELALRHAAHVIPFSKVLDHETFIQGYRRRLDDEFRFSLCGRRRFMVEHP